MDDERRVRELYEEVSEKQYGASRRIIFLVFTLLGFFMLMIGAILYIADVGAQENHLPTMIVCGMGLFWVLLGVIMRMVMPERGNFDSYQRRMAHYGAQSTSDIAVTLKMLEARVAELEKRVGKQDGGL